MGALSRSRTRGSALVAVLLVLTILLILGVAFLNQKSAQYEAEVSARRATQASAIAQAGLIDARAKCIKDKTFPPIRPEETTIYTYSEDFTDLDGEIYGSYTVTLDTALVDKSEYVMKVRSDGFVGPRGKPEAVSSMEAEIDMKRELSTVPVSLNPSFMKWKSYSRTLE